MGQKNTQSTAKNDGDFDDKTAILSPSPFPSFSPRNMSWIDEIRLNIPSRKENTSPQQTSTPTPTQEPTSTPEPVHRYSNIKNMLSEEEIEFLAQIVYLEAGLEPDLGQQAVIEVIFNRINYYKYPNTLREVIFQKGQFAVVSRYEKGLGLVREKELKNIKLVLEGKTNILPDDTVYFATRPLTDRVVVKIGVHYFCRDGVYKG